ncbi:MAG: DinB family protein [Bacteroidota bacterium]
MENISHITARLREVVIDGRWIANTNWQDQLSQTSLAQAKQQIGSLNTIAALTYHVDYYLSGVADFFETGKLLISDKHSFDVPDMQSEAEWEALKQRLYDNAERFNRLVEEMPAEKMGEIFVLEKYGTYMRNIQGMIEHIYYHLGQVVIIRKLLSEQE